jgi:nucleoid DNA-binding protein
MSISKSTIVDEIAKKTKAKKTTKAQIQEVLDLAFEVIINSLAEGKRIELRGFGVFKNKIRKPRTARNPKTGVEVQLNERTVPVFKASPDFVKKVNK